MWRAEQDPAAASGCKAAAPTEFSVTFSAFQHPVANPTPFSTYPSAWIISPQSLPDGPSCLPSRASGNAPSIVHAPSDLLPNGLLATPQPSTPATTLLKVLVNNRLTISGQESGYGSGNGQITDSPANSGGHVIRPLDSLVLPSPSLLPGGVHSLPTPTSASSQQPKGIDAYGSRGSPVETASSKESIPCASADAGSSARQGSAHTSRPSAGGASRRVEASPTQHISRSGSGAGSSGSSGAGSGRAVDGSSSSAGQYHGLRNAGNYAGYGSAGLQYGNGIPHPGLGNYHVSQHAHAPKAAAAAAAAIAGLSKRPGSPPGGYTVPAYYMTPMAPGPVMMGAQQPAGTCNGGNAGGGGAGSRVSAGGNGMPTATREGNGGSFWRGSRSAGGASAGQGGKLAAHQYGPGQQQMMQGPMVHDVSGSGPYGMAHMHPGPYAVYGMMAPGIVMPSVLPPVMNSPRGMEALGHQPVHMGPMVIQHGPSMAMGMGMGHHMHHAFPAHSQMGGPPMGMQPHAHMTVHGFSLSHGPHYHGSHGMGGGYGQGQQPYGHAGLAGMQAHGGPYGSGRAAGSKGAGTGGAGSQQLGKAARNAGGGGGEGGSGGASGTGGSARDSPVAGRGRPGGREKAEGKSKSAEQRERKPGNSRAPAVVAQCVAEMPSLEEQLQNLVRQLTPGQDELAAHQAALTAVSKLVGSRWPAVKVHLFGSAANGLSIAGSNEIDITLEVPGMPWDDHAAKSAMVSALGELASGVPPATASPVSASEPKADAEAGECAGAEAVIVAQASGPADGAAAFAAASAVGPEPEAAESDAEADADDLEAEPDAEGAEADAPAEAAEARLPTGMASVIALPKARTPVVKMTVESTQTRVDVTMNNLLAISNTRMLGQYCEVDPRLRQLALLVKHWARTRSVNDAYRGSLSSYAYVLLCIWVLQQRKPAILPVLQQREPHTYDTTVGPWRCSYNDQVEEVKNFGAENKETLAELVVAFFDHWAWRHDYNGSVVCVRTGSTVTKSSKEWTKRQGNERHLMCIEDPFELSHDLGRTIDKAAVQVLRREFERAARIFASNPDPLPELLAPLTPEEEATVTAALQSRRKASKEKEKEKERAKAAAAAAAAVAGIGGEGGAVAAATVAGEEEGLQRGSEQGSDGEDDSSREGQPSGGVSEQREGSEEAAAADADAA
ncbi:hypothetical protein PLESTB_000086200 [Pleodorina starrii]|uniref:Polynucleotide adenylyltransferase n=1 Tax=Pleodorina starrii TaxID=330485 RepID=A0A9W6EXT3_9CHLO|nr:hypothetical protein PLESTB_000086200 [Pleodorina starrii]GLC66629.1 hypothetical protein PLESTF_000451800 [Pleodorina starrii]